MDWLTGKAQQLGDQECVVSSDGVFSYDQIATMVEGRVRTLGDRSGAQLVVQPRLDVASVVELLAIPLTGATMVVVGPERTDADHLIALARTELRPSHTILFTSGSSGVPKGVRLSAANWEAAARASASHLGHGEADRWLCVLPLHHVGGLSIIYRSLFAGGTVVLESDPERTGAWMDRVSWVSLVSTQLFRLLQQRTDRWQNSPRVLLGGGPVDPVLLETAKDAGLLVLLTYGMTETTAQVASAVEPGGPLLPLPGIGVQEVGGRLQVTGPTVMLGYVGQPEAGGSFLTNDLGSVERGEVVVAGRSDRVIISGGENVDPATVEAALELHPEVIEVVVIGVPDPDWGEMVVAVLVGPVGDDELNRSVAGLPRFARPKRWIRLDALPRTDLGKVDQGLLLDRIRGQTSADPV